MHQPLDYSTPLLERVTRAVAWIGVACKAFDGLCCVASSLLCEPRTSDGTEPPMSLLDALLLGDLRLPRPSPPPDGGHLPNVLQRLYLRLLTNAQFKEAFARAYARHYLPLATGFCAADQSQDDAIFSSQISVQFLNRPSLVAPLADQGMLRTMLVALAQVVASAEDEATGKLGAASVLLARRRYVPVLADLRFVLAIEGVAASFLLRKTTLLSEWMGFLRRIQAMDAQQRQRGEHVLREHETWVNAFNFSIHLSSMYRLLLKPLAAQPHIAAGPHAAAAAAAAAAAYLVEGQ